MMSVPTTQESPSQSPAEMAQRLVTVYGNKETEFNWVEMDELLRSMTAALTTPQGQVQCDIFWIIREPLIAALSTERTRLALSAIDLVSAISALVKDHFEGLYDLYLAPLMKLGERTNKVISQRAQKTLLELMRNDPVIGARYYFGKMQDGMQSANKILRQCAADMLLGMILARKCVTEEFNENELLLIAKILTDAAPNVRQTGKALFQELQDAEREFVTRMVPLNIQKTLLGIPVQEQPKPSLSSLVTSKLHTPKREFIDLMIIDLPVLSNTQSQQQQQGDGKPQRQLSHQSSSSSISRLPIGPAKRTHENPKEIISKNAMRVLKNVFVLDQDSKSAIPQSKAIRSADKKIGLLVDLNQKKEWNQRADYLDHLRVCRDQWTRQIYVKLSEIAISGLSDLHFRVVEGGFKLLQELFEMEIVGDLEECLVRMHMALVTHRSRKTIIELFHNTFILLSENTNLFPIYYSCLSRLDVMGSVKQKTSMLRSLEDLIKQHLPNRSELAMQLKPIVGKVSNGLIDSDPLIAACTRALFLVIVAALGKSLTESTVLPAVRSQGCRALLQAAMDANPSLLPRTPPRHVPVQDDDEISLLPSIQIHMSTPRSQISRMHDCQVQCDLAGDFEMAEVRGIDKDVEELALKLIATPIK